MAMSSRAVSVEAVAAIVQKHGLAKTDLGEEPHYTVFATADRLLTVVFNDAPKEGHPIVEVMRSYQCVLAGPKDTGAVMIRLGESTGNCASISCKEVLSGVRGPTTLVLEFKDPASFSPEKLDLVLGELTKIVDLPSYVRAEELNMIA